MRFAIWRFNQEFLRHSINVPNQVFVHSLGISARVGRMDYDVIHDKVNNEFYIELGGQEKAVLQYQFLGEKQEIMDVYHTGVPESQRGKGVAGQLVKAAFSFVVAQNLKVRPTCTYVEHYINKNKPSNILERLEK